MLPVDFYCERVAAGFGGEPLNALSALAFLVLGVWRLRTAPHEADALAGFGLVLLGIAAVLHHLFALTVTHAADIWANTLFLVVFVTLFLRRLAGMGPVAILPAAAGVLAVTQGLQLPAVRAALGLWSDAFAVETLCLGLLAAALARTAQQTARGLAIATLLLAAGLPFRFLDHALCASFPFGTHWIWHLFNAASIAVVLVTLGRHDMRRAEGGAG